MTSAKKRFLDPLSPSFRNFQYFKAILLYFQSGSRAIEKIFFTVKVVIFVMVVTSTIGLMH